MENLVNKTTKRRMVKNDFVFDVFYEKLSAYLAEKGNLLVPSYYETSDGYPLGMRVRGVRSGLIKLNEEEIDKINALGFVWNAKEFNFEIFYDKLLEYKREKGNLLVPHDYKTADGYKLGKKVARLRTGGIKLSETDEKRLNDIDFIWNTYDYLFDVLINELLKYKALYGDLYVPIDYVTKDGYRLGRRVSNLRAGTIKVTKNREEQLNNIGFVWSAWQHSDL